MNFDELYLDRHNLSTVRINEQRINDFIGQMGIFDRPAGIFDHLEFPSELEKLNFIFFFNVVNFCFWNDVDWVVNVDGQDHSRTEAMVQALYSAFIKNNYDFTTLTYEEYEEIFMGNGQLQFFRERFDSLVSSAKKLSENFNGDFRNIIKASNYNALELVVNISRYFPNFDDYFIIDDKKYFFYKRAQICVEQIGRYVSLGSMDQLTGFSDYRIPQILRHLGILEYIPELQTLIDNEELLPENSFEEFEIRVATLKCISMLRKAYEVAYGKKITAGEIDGFLWMLTRNSAGPMEPHHRTKTMHY